MTLPSWPQIEAAALIDCAANVLAEYAERHPEVRSRITPPVIERIAEAILSALQRVPLSGA